MTLVELLIAMGVLSLIMSMVVVAVASGLRGSTRMTTEMDTVRQGTVAADRLQRELRTCQQVYFPDPTSGAWTDDGTTDVSYVPNSTDTPFIFTHGTYPPQGPALNGMEVVAYKWDDRAQTLNYLLYDPTTFNPGGTMQPLNGAQWQTTATKVTDFKVTRYSLGNTHGVQYVGISMTIQANDQLSVPIGLRTTVESLYPGQ